MRVVGLLAGTLRTWVGQRRCAETVALALLDRVLDLCGEVAPEDPVEVARVSRHHLAQHAFLVLAEIEAQLAVSPDQLSAAIEPLGGARDAIELIEVQRKVR